MRIRRASKTLLAGPWVGEFGWELFCWQAYLRKLARHYDEVIVIGRPGHAALYADFSHRYIPFDPRSNQTDAWKCADALSAEELVRTIPCSTYVSGQFHIGMRYTRAGVDDRKGLFFNEQHFIPYRFPEIDAEGYDLILHCRNKSTGNERNWPAERWRAFRALLPKGLRLASVGNAEAFHLEGTDDLRGIEIASLIAVFNRSRLLVSPSSGPAHLAALSGLRHLVWSTEYNRVRYERDWNPFRTPVEFYGAGGWDPEPAKIAELVRETLSYPLPACRPRASFARGVSALPKLIILPAAASIRGGGEISLAATLKGLAAIAPGRFCVVVRSHSPLERFFLEQGIDAKYLVSLSSPNRAAQLRRALAWVQRQPPAWPLLLEGGAHAELMNTLLAGVPALRLSGRRVVYSFRDLTRSGHWRVDLKRALLFKLLRPEGVFNSHYTASLAGGRATRRRTVIYPAIDPRVFNESPVDPVALPPELREILGSSRRILLMPGRFVGPDSPDDKRQRVLIHVLKELNRRGENCHGLFIAPVSPRASKVEELRRMAQLNGVEDRIAFLPPTADLDLMRGIYRASTVALTLSAREPFGRVVPEAISCGRPVLAAGSGGTGEVLRQFAPRWAVDPNRADEIAERLVELWRDPGATRDYIRRGQAWVAENCDAGVNSTALWSAIGVGGSGGPEFR